MKFKKDSEVMFISHLDMMRTFERALRRADLPVTFSQGFNPRPRISFTPALSVGITSSCEYVDVELYEQVSVEDVIQRLNKTLPEGIHIIKAGLADESLPLSTLNGVIYIVNIALPTDKLQDLDKSINAFLHQEEITVEKVTKSRTKLVNIAPLIYKISILKSGNNSASLSMMLSIGQEGSVSPKVIVTELEKSLEKELEILSIHREKLFLWRDNKIILPL
jgi:radical SAM-linked protein